VLLGARRAAGGAPFAWQAAIEQTDRHPGPQRLSFREPVHRSLQPERNLLGRSLAPPLPSRRRRELLKRPPKAHDTWFRPAACCGPLVSVRPTGRDMSQHTPMEAALGASVETRLPQGRHASQWRRLLTEVRCDGTRAQANQAREAGGSDSHCAVVARRRIVAKPEE